MSYVRGWKAIPLIFFTWLTGSCQSSPCQAAKGFFLQPCLHARHGLPSVSSSRAECNTSQGSACHYMRLWKFHTYTLLNKALLWWKSSNSFCSNWSIRMASWCFHKYVKLSTTYFLGHIRGSSSAVWAMRHRVHTSRRSSKSFERTCKVVPQECHSLLLLLRSVQFHVDIQLRTEASKLPPR